MEGERRKKRFAEIQVVGNLMVAIFSGCIADGACLGAVQVMVSSLASNTSTESARYNNFSISLFPVNGVLAENNALMLLASRTEGTPAI